MRDHLKTAHPAFWRNIYDDNTPSVSKYIHSTPSWKRQGKFSKQYNRYLARFVISANLPLYIVGNKWLQKCVQIEYVLPSRTYFGKNIIEPMVDETKGSVCEKLKQASAVAPQ